ncbi:MAG: malto-oligosyltrehalose synthase [Phycisphaerales bacterium]|nr:malto-oligosyltrehalose synthase [Phycisphaerales bacterium]
MAADPIDVLLNKAIEHAKAIRRLPVSTYRLQFHAGFTFRDATRILPYLAKLGVTHVYASPYLAATAGSTHGYDVIDHCRLNPEVGTAEDYDAFLDGLAANGLSHILDTVPNHVGIATNDNSWWNDVLEHGPSSLYARYFDISWQSSSRPELADKVLIPTLGKPYGDAVDAGELQLSLNADAGRFWVNYFQRRFPISPHTYGRILRNRIESLKEESNEILDIATAADRLVAPPLADPDAVEDRMRDSDSIKSRLADLLSKSPAVLEHLNSVLADLNGTPGDAGSFDRLDELLRDQCFRLADWHVAFDEINYRRFFDVNDLAALSMERPEVFEATHQFILPLLAAGKIAGLRIDHPDGLYDPAEYLKRLQQHFLLAIAETLYDGSDWPTVRTSLLERMSAFDGMGEGADRWPLFVSVEKILAMDEPLIADWATHGTSGYDFLVMLNGLFVDGQAEPAIDALWKDITGNETSFANLAYRNKRMMLETSLASELHSLTHRLDLIAQRRRRSLDFTFRTLQTVIRETFSSFSVYRTYVAGPAVTEVDRGHIQSAIASAKARNPRVVPAAFDFLQDMLLQRYAPTQSAEDRLHQQRFAGKFQQLTSPVTAKGIEDTTFYQFNRFLSLNEVGGEPGTFGVTPERFHQFLKGRQRHWPFALSGSSTHDTKRSEDVRARLNVLSDIPDEWAPAVKQWFTANTSLRQVNNGLTSPSPGEEMLIYQTLIGAWPVAGEDMAAFAERVQAYVLKAIREAKLRTRWGEPDEAHEAAVAAFVAALLDPAKSPEFHRTFGPLLKKVSHFGLLNSLSQTLLKLVAPGVPDTYQGTELWDFSLVDPDNRRPVDYPQRERLLNEIETAASADLLGSMTDGRIKLKVTAAGLRLRRQHAELFANGDYAPIRASGERAANVFVFSRCFNDKTVVAVVQRGAARFIDSATGLPIGHVWGNTRLELPAVVAWQNALTGERVTSDQASELFASLPVALLISTE